MVKTDDMLQVHSNPPHTHTHTMSVTTNGVMQNSCELYGLPKYLINKAVLSFILVYIN